MLTLISNDELKDLLRCLLIDDDDGITKYAIVSSETDNVVLIDNDGTINYHIPSEGGTVVAADVDTCLSYIADDVDEAIEQFEDYLYN